MLKKMLFISLLIPMSLLAAHKECKVKPSYDIVINKENVHIFNKTTDLIINPKGNVVLNNKSIPLDPQLIKETKQFQQDLRQQLPQLEQQAYILLGEVKQTFDQAIKNKLGDDNELHGQLNKLYKRLVKLLHRSIITDNGETRFYYQNYNNIRQEGEDIGQHIFYNVIGSSILQFDLLKNYGAIKQISKNEWKTQKPKLKAFDAHICAVITSIDGQYQQILTELQ
ncbi:hypothetical protein A9G13_05660 [Gilliamella sp. wkB178]|uniref:DUF2884 family protein n=1 Tax=Gilliamella sp. wkB178 TaxID=3120259 RepID=UPI00080E84DF|nr:DUF2884 family protein [Gilliamella apicola]OCG07700.1 hypothetical protein A9G13_05660 [Gilliamella apicola]